MNRKNNILSIILLAIGMTTNIAVFARVEGGFNNEGYHGLNNNHFQNHNNEYNNGYNNQFYYNKHLNDNNGVLILPDDSNIDSSCQTTQVCDSDGNCMTQQNCD